MLLQSEAKIEPDLRLRAGRKIKNYKKSLHLANSYHILFRQEQLTQSKYAFVSCNDNRNLRKYIIDFIVKLQMSFQTEQLQNTRPLYSNLFTLCGPRRNVSL